jgi:hypothetical protein
MKNRVRRPLSVSERRTIADVLGINDVSDDAITAGCTKAAVQEMWEAMGAETQVGLLVEWLIGRAADTYGDDAAIKQLIKELELRATRQL